MRNLFFVFFFFIISASAYIPSETNPGVILDRLSIFTLEQPPLFNGTVLQRVHIHPRQVGLTHNTILILIDGQWFAVPEIFSDGNCLFVEIKTHEFLTPFTIDCTNFHCGRTVCPNIRGLCPWCNTALIFVMQP